MSPLIATVVAAGLVGLGLLLGLCRSAAVGDRVQIDDTERCPVCGDPTGVRCCEFGKDRA